jgi:2-isopropylmalate synthase
MKTRPKYAYPQLPPLPNRQWPDRQIAAAPIWCSVDLRDGNQALPVPMNPEKKLNYFETLIKIGVKEIEVGFPSASLDDFTFTRRLIEENRIPQGVRISVLTQARQHLIDRTVEALAGVPSAILHCYVATSDLHGQLVFNRDRNGVRQMAVDGTRMAAEALARAGLRKNVAYEFSPEEFTDSDPDFVVDLCEAVCETWGGSSKDDFILNLPATVERRPPYQYADMIEYFLRKYRHADKTTISIHAHNDQGCAVAATEMALLAGAERVEGTLFGHGERTGNVDLIVLAMNLHCRGLDTGLDFSDMDEIVKVVESASLIPVHPRHPYAGELVFTAFSGSHQDAIRKGLDARDKAGKLFGVEWKVPYLHVDPADLGRDYERIIRINSQSGKGGAAYVLEHEYGIIPPKAMQPDLGRAVQRLADATGAEISAEQLLATFRNEFIEVKGPYELRHFQRLTDNEDGTVRADVTIAVNGHEHAVKSEGNGPISALVNALCGIPGMLDFRLDDFVEQSLGHTADATAISYISIIRNANGRKYFGAGEHANIDRAAMAALFAALNRAASSTKENSLP